MKYIEKQKKVGEKWLEAFHIKIDIPKNIQVVFIKKKMLIFFKTQIHYAQLFFVVSQWV